MTRYLSIKSLLSIVNVARRAVWVMGQNGFEFEMGSTARNVPGWVFKTGSGRNGSLL